MSKKHFIDTKLDVISIASTDNFKQNLLYFIDKYNKNGLAFSADYYIKMMTTEMMMITDWKKTTKLIQHTPTELALLKKMYLYYVKNLNYKHLTDIVSEYNKKVKDRLKKEQDEKEELRRINTEKLQQQANQQSNQGGVQENNNAIINN